MASIYLKKVALFLCLCYNSLMKKQSTGKSPQIFKIKLSTTMLLLCVAVFILCATGVGLSVWRIRKFGVNGFNDVIKYPFLIAVCLFCVVLMIALLIKSQYMVDDTFVYTQYGFIKSRFTITDVTAIVYNTNNKKLTVNFGEEYTILSVDPTWQEQFVRAMLDVKPEIDYSFTLTQAPNKK